MPEELIDRQLLQDWVWHAIEELSPSLRVVAMLRYFSEVSSYEQIAIMCELPIGTVRSRLSRGRDQLRRLMGMEERLSRQTSVKNDPAERNPNDEAPARRLNFTLDAAKSATL